MPKPKNFDLLTQAAAAWWRETLAAHAPSLPALVLDRFQLALVAAIEERVLTASEATALYGKRNAGYFAQILLEVTREPHGALAAAAHNAGLPSTGWPLDTYAYLDERGLWTPNVFKTGPSHLLTLPATHE